MRANRSGSTVGTTARPRLAMPPSSTPVLIRTLRLGFIVASGVALLAAVAGFFFAGWVGVISAVVGAAVAAVFLGITAASILVANRFDIAAFFAIVLGSWLVKFALFLMLAFALRGQTWISAPVLFLTLIAGATGSLVVDVVVVARTRVPHVSDIELPEQRVSESSGGSRGNGWSRRLRSDENGEDL